MVVTRDDIPNEGPGSTGLFAVGEGHTAAMPDRAHGRELEDEAALGTLAMSVVHDLRSPLATIYSGAEMLNRSQLPEQHVRRLAQNIYDASVRIQELLENYVDLYRTRQRQSRSSNLREVVAHAVDRFGALAETQSAVVTYSVPTDLVVAVDHLRMTSVLANLLANALEAMPAGGSVHISAIPLDTSVLVRVLDTGPGVAPEIREKLFQPFATARKSNGWGLGLAQARQVVIDHGGDMWLESPLGGGACFAFTVAAS